MQGISNEELVQKAVITTDAIASQGKLNAAQADRFIDFVIQETILKDAARTVRSWCWTRRTRTSSERR